MAVAERGSFLWMMFAVTQVFLSIKLVGEVEGWITTLFGGSAAAAFMLAVVIFRQEQRDLILNPLKMSREVNEDAIKGHSPPNSSSEPSSMALIVVTVPGSTGIMLFA